MQVPRPSNLSFLVVARHSIQFPIDFAMSSNSKALSLPSYVFIARAQFIWKRFANFC